MGYITTYHIVSYLSQGKSERGRLIAVQWWRGLGAQGGSAVERAARWGAAVKWLACGLELRLNGAEAVINGPQLIGWQTARSWDPGPAVECMPGWMSGLRTIVYA